MHQIKYFNSVLLVIVLFVACSDRTSRQKAQRVKLLGLDIVQFVHNGDYNAPLPNDLAFLGHNTFWNIFKIKEPVSSSQIQVTDARNIDEKADFLLDIGTYIGLRIKYDQEIDKFHILGFQGTQLEIEESTFKNIWNLEQELYKIGEIRSSEGMAGLIINKSTKKEIFKSYQENIFHRVGFWFEFENEILKSLYISRFQLETSKGIRTQSSTKSEIIDKYGPAITIRKQMSFLNKKLKNIELLVYDGIEFLILNDELMLIIVN